jgi:hypothetical protein
MQREVIQTEDGSKTIRIIDLNENYHSIHGALQEANHVFMKYGLLEFQNKEELSVFEMGFVGSTKMGGRTGASGTALSVHRTTAASMAANGVAK